MADPTNVFAMDDIKFMTGLNVEPVIASETSIQMAIGKVLQRFDARSISLTPRSPFEAEKVGSQQERKERHQQRANSQGCQVDERLVGFGSRCFARHVSSSTAHDGEDFEVIEDNDEIDLAALARASEDAPVVRLVNVLMVDSLRRGASDIHVEPYEKDFRIRFRIDGVLYDVMHPPMKIRDPLISRLKIMAKLDISEKRLPQDGRIKIKVKIDNRSRELDFRVSTLPTLVRRKGRASSAR